MENQLPRKPISMQTGEWRENHRLSRMKMSELDSKIHSNVVERYRESVSGKDEYSDVFKELLDGLSIKYSTKVKVGDLYYDFLVEDTNTLIYFNDSLTSNSEFDKDTGYGMSIYKARTLYENAERFGMKCIQIYDWDDISRIVIHVKKKKELSVSDLHIDEIGQPEYQLFHYIHDIEHDYPDRGRRFGIYSDNLLIAVLSFSSFRHGEGVELLGFCKDSEYEFTLNSDVMRKLSKKAKFTRATSYVNLSKNNGSDLENMGFSFEGYTIPLMQWSRGGQKIPAEHLYSKGYEKMFGHTLPKGKGPKIAMMESGWVSVYDSGKKIYTWRATK